MPSGMVRVSLLSALLLLAAADAAAAMVRLPEVLPPVAGNPADRLLSVPDRGLRLRAGKRGKRQAQAQGGHDGRAPRPRPHRHDQARRRRPDLLLEQGALTSRHTRWMRRTALLACLVGAAVLGGGYLASAPRVTRTARPRALTGARPPRRTTSTAKLPPLPKSCGPAWSSPWPAPPASRRPSPSRIPAWTIRARSPRAPRARAATGRPACRRGQRRPGRARRPRSPTASRCRRSRRPRPCAQIIEAGNSIARTPVQVGRRPRQVAGHGLRLLGLRLVRARRRRTARRAAGLRAADVLGQGRARASGSRSTRTRATSTWRSPASASTPPARA